MSRISGFHLKYIFSNEISSFSFFSNSLEDCFINKITIGIFFLKLYLIPPFLIILGRMFELNILLDIDLAFRESCKLLGGYY